MRVFVAGATGVVGRPLVTRLVEAGHEVWGMTRREDRQDDLRAWGARPVVADALDADEVAGAVERAAPDVIVHQLTAIGEIDTRHMDRAFAVTNRLRTEGTDHLLAAGRAVGVDRFVAQSHVLRYARKGAAVLTEDAPTDADPPAVMRNTQRALGHLEAAVLGATWTEGVVLRYGWFYGPGTSLSVGEPQIERIRHRQFPIVGNGAGVWSFTHAEDAASGAFAAVTRGRRGVYNIVDDDPATVAEWLPVVAARLGARPPLRVPRIVGRWIAGEVGAMMMTDIRGVANAKARAELDWRPTHASWREGLAA